MVLKLFEFKEEFLELTLHFSGIILSKAEMEKDFNKVYSKVFEVIYSLENFEIEEFLEIFGEVGG